MASVTKTWIERCPGVSHYNPIITIQGRIHHSIGVSIPPEGLRLSYFSGYIEDSDFAEQSRI